MTVVRDAGVLDANDDLIERGDQRRAGDTCSIHLGTGASIAEGRRATAKDAN